MKNGEIKYIKQGFAFGYKLKETSRKSKYEKFIQVLQGAIFGRTRSETWGKYIARNRL